MQITFDIAGQAVGGFVAAAAVLLQRLHDDPIELAAHQPAELSRVALAPRGNRLGLVAERAQSGAGTWRLFFADDPADLVEGGAFQTFLVERGGAGEKLVEENAQTVD